MVKNNLSVECKIHGLHNEWRYHSQNNVQCKICASEWRKKRKIQNPLREILKDAKQHSKKTGRKFEITIQDLEEILLIQENMCSLTGVKFDESNFPSLDRIDSNFGYIKENIQLILIKINRMKTDLNQNEFIDLCKYVSRKSLENNMKCIEKKSHEY